MKKKTINISNPDDLQKHLQHTSISTWFILCIVIAILISFFLWSALFKLPIRIMGTAHISNQEATLLVKEKDIEKLKVGQVVKISNLEGHILSIDDNQPVVSTFDLQDGEYTYFIYVGEKRPFDFMISR